MEALELPNFGNQTGIFLLSDYQNIEQTKSKHPGTIWYRIESKSIRQTDVILSKTIGALICVHLSIYLCYCNLHKLSVGFLFVMTSYIRTQFKKDTLWGQPTFRLSLLFYSQTVFVYKTGWSLETPLCHSAKKKFPISAERKYKKYKNKPRICYYSDVQQYAEYVILKVLSSEMDQAESRLIR
jgi:hypothetical protein